MNFDVKISNSGFPYFINLCKKVGCEKSVYCKRMCLYHYNREREIINKNRKCKICPKNVWKGSYCFSHHKIYKGRFLCKISDCKEKSIRNQKCQTHMNSYPILCKENGCTKPVLVYKKGLCSSHYHKNRRKLIKIKNSESMDIEMKI